MFDDLLNLTPSFIKGLSIPQLEELAEEVRQFLIKEVSASGGHLSSNLGMVELTLALHYVFDLPKDCVLWDVGHQGYTHKLITERGNLFHTLRQDGGLSGFINKEESPYDSSSMGHASVALSQALGFRAARDLKGENHKVIALMGDGSLTGGEAFEALNNVGQLQKDLILILNDNEHSISLNVGALAKYLSHLRSSRRYQGLKRFTKSFLKKFPGVGTWILKKIDRLKFALKAMILPSLLFESFGFSYLGPIDGHDLRSLIEVLTRAKNFSTPVLVHVLTIKGKGYPPAEKDPVFFHSAPPFHMKTGLPTYPPQLTYTDVVRKTLPDLAKTDQKIVCITAAMAQGTGLEDFTRLYPDRFFDVGIAEQHAVSFAAGLALNGFHPVVAIYSTFLQRAYDQIFHDVCLQRLPVLFLIDRAGLVPADGPTHQGIYDLGYLRMMPNLSILTPSSGQELRDMIFTSFKQRGPVAIRYPKEEIPETLLPQENNLLPWGKGVALEEGEDLSFLAWGPLLQTALQAKGILGDRGLKIGVYNMRFLVPLDKELLKRAYQSDLLISLEENFLEGGASSLLLEAFNEMGLNSNKLKRLGITSLPGIGSRHYLLDKFGLTSQKVAQQALSLLKEKAAVNF